MTAGDPTVTFTAHQTDGVKEGIYTNHNDALEITQAAQTLAGRYAQADGPQQAVRLSDALVLREDGVLDLAQWVYDKLDLIS